MVIAEVSDQAQGLESQAGRRRVCGKEILHRRTVHPRRFLSKGVRIYYHEDGKRHRVSFQQTAGTKAVLLHIIFGYGRLTAVGQEEGAMVAHFKMPPAVTAADL